MDDFQILDLYWQRSQQAISETSTKYGPYCYSIAYNILSSHEDAEESVNDTYLAAWNAIPPQRPSLFSAFLGKITRHLSLDRWRSLHRQKRGSGQMILAIEELDRDITSGDTVESALEARRFTQTLNRFLDSLPERERRIFLCRYWYLDKVTDIAACCGLTPNHVSAILRRTRQKFRTLLEQEDLL